MSYDNNEEKQKITNYLLSVLKYNICKFKNMELILFKPEPSSFNKIVRDWLSEKEINYGIDY